MKLEIAVRETKPGVLTVTPSGSVDSDTYARLDEEITRLLAEPLKTLILDMAGVDFITSSGIGTIAKARTALVQRNAQLAMINLQPQVKKVFEIMRLTSALNVFESRDELDEYLGRIQRQMTEQDDL